MGPVFAEIVIDAPRERVHDYLMDLATRPRIYGDSIRHFRLLRLDSRGVGAGARFQFKRRSKWADTTITDSQAPIRISERGETGKRNSTPNGTEWELAESSAGMTRLRVSYWTEPSGMAKMFDRMTGGAGWHHRRLKRAAGQVRDLIEADQEVTEPVGVAGGNRYATGVL